ncbi:MAG TPA: DMT family transporter, partial [Acidobacteriota bacterium]|nr:DMT family transporter [Acidobacteriota bacterium]
MKKYSILLVILGSMLWGTDSLFRRPLTQELSPVTIVFLEHCVLCIVLIPVFLRAKSVVLHLAGREWLSLAFIAAGGSVAATSLFTFSIKYGNPSVTVLLQKTQPVLTILLARWLLRERPGRWFWYWVPPALCGAYLISNPDWRAGVAIQAGQMMSIIAALGASALWGASTVFGRFVAARLPALTLTGLRFLLALPVLAAAFYLQPVELQHLPSTFTSWAAVTAMALLPGLL